MKFSAKLATGIISLTLLIAGATSGVLYLSSSQMLREQLQSRLDGTCDSSQRRLDRFLFERIADLQTMASDQVVAAEHFTPSTAAKRLREYRDNYQAYLTISIFQDGMRVADASSLEIGARQPDDGFWTALLASDGPVVAATPASSFGKNTIRIGAPVAGRDGRYVVTYIGVDLVGQTIHAEIESLALDASFFLSDQSGNLLFGIQNKAGLWDEAGPILQELALRDEDSAGRGVTIGGQRYIAAISRSTGYLSQAGSTWTMFGLGPEQTWLAPLGTLQSRLIPVWGAGLVLMLIGLLYLSRSVVVPVQRVTLAARKIAAGDLDVQLAVKSNDEVGSLAAAFKQMNHALSEIAGMATRVAGGDLRVGVEPRGQQDRLGTALADMQRNMVTQIGRILEAATVLAGSGAQISAFSSQLTCNAAESAAAVSETTATVEEVKQTALLSSENAREVSAAAQATADISWRGEQSVRKTRELMETIRQRMAEIGDNIMSLKEKGQAIGEIIMSVGELSDQSNVLAVNAAIEAARAGDHGRGFTVVAEEIRFLSEQSKGATEQARRLLNDVQKATKAAVLSMKSGSLAMAEGLEQSSESGEAIRQLTEHIVRDAEAAIQIAASSRQQLAGMDQVAMAMEAIRDSTEQNVDSTRQMEQQVQNLTDLGEFLRSTVTYYRLPPEAEENSAGTEDTANSPST